MNKKLSQRQEKFIDEYLVDLNATGAAVRAGYSEKTARVIGAQNLSKLNIQEAIQERRRELSEIAKIDQERVLKEEACIAFFDMGGLFNSDGSIIPPHQLSEDVRKAIASVEIVVTPIPGTDKEKTSHKFRFNDKGRALERIAKHLGMFERDNTQKGPQVIVIPDGRVNKPSNSGRGK